MKIVPRPRSFRIGRREVDATRDPALDELSGLTLAFVTISTGLPDADAGRGSACMHPLNTTSRLGLAFGCPAAVAARHRHVMAESPIRLIVHPLSRRIRSTSGPADKLQFVRQSNLTSQ